MVTGDLVEVVVDQAVMVTEAVEVVVGHMVIGIIQDLMVEEMIGEREFIK
tara:strand:+ start:214 stop:363 length:150 start_codon:yes stop_codon:yes gene_type:complete